MLFARGAISASGDFEKSRSGNTLDAHRLLHLARERGVQDDVKERLFRAFFTEGEAIGDPETLVRLVSEVGDPCRGCSGCTELRCLR